MRVAISVTLEMELIKRLDAESKKREVSRSWLINKLLKEALNG
jgi:metal-responsive CopG/Arc/MetJ family transcriptional regulator